MEENFGHWHYIETTGRTELHRYPHTGPAHHHPIPSQDRTARYTRHSTNPRAVVECAEQPKPKPEPNQSIYNNDFLNCTT